MASSDVLPITPGPHTPHTLASFFTRYFIPTPGIAPVLMALNIFALMRQRGAPVVLSFNITVRMDLGSPFSLFVMLEPYHFIPMRSKGPPIYAGIAINLLSSPSSKGILGNGDVLGNET